MKMKFFAALAGLAFLLVAGGCSTYYKVTDPASDKVFYTNDLDRNKNGAVVFTDGATGNEVTLQNSELQKIKKKEYKEHLPQDD